MDAGTSNNNTSRARTSPKQKAPEVPRLYTGNSSYTASAEQSSRPETSEPDLRTPQTTPGEGPVRRTVADIPPSPAGRSVHIGRPNIDGREDTPGVSIYSESPHADYHGDYDMFTDGGGREVRRRRPHHYTIGAPGSETPPDSYTGRLFDEGEEAWGYADGILMIGMVLVIKPWAFLPTPMSRPALQTVGHAYDMASHRRIDRSDERRAGVAYFQNQTR